MTATHPTPLDRQNYLAEHITDELMDHQFHQVRA